MLGGETQWLLVRIVSKEETAIDVMTYIELATYCFVFGLNNGKFATNALNLVVVAIEIL